ncbi:MAG: Crp/Fnr family transcriptional regulator [Bacteroidales bacterium]|jgi:CRP-like cAMP-binding protein|nr:Crp/Fnr family transcriptional regulator [Bacteroidales bacterium]
MNELELFSCPIFSQIPANERDDFLDKIQHRIKNIKKGDYIANQNDEIRELHILLKGSVKAEMISGAGTVLYIETIIAPSLLAHAFLFASPNRFPVDVIAIEECEEMLITKQSIMKYMSENEYFMQEFMSLNANKTKFLSERLQYVPLKTIKGKLAMYILQQAKGLTFVFDKNQTQLAEYFGVERPSLARSLSEMQKDGIISLNKKNGNILNIILLQKLIV